MHYYEIIYRNGQVKTPKPPYSIVKILLILQLLFNVNTLTAQVSKTDSLKAILKQTNSDTVKCNVLAKLISLNRESGWEGYYGQLKALATNNYKQATTPLLKTFYHKKLHTCIEIEARAQRLKGNYDSAIILQKQGAQLAQELNLLEREANAYNSIGSLYHRKGDAFNAIQWLEKSLKAYSKIKDSVGIMKLTTNLGALNNDFGDPDQAISYYRQALSMGKRFNDVINQSATLTNLAICLDKQGKIDSALYYYHQAIKMLVGTNNYEGLGTSYCNIGNIYYDKKDFKEALKFHQMGLETYLKGASTEGEATANCFIAADFFDLNQREKAMPYAEKGLAQGKELGSPDIIFRAAYQLASIYESKGDFKRAYEMEKLYVNMRDSLKNNETEDILMKSHYKYEYSKKLEADSLKAIQLREISDLKFEKQENEKRFLYILIALVILFGAFIFNRFRNTNKQKKIIEMANKDLERQHLLNQKIFSVISHDFRGPMLSLSYMLDKFKQKSTDKALNSYVQEVNTEVNNANVVLNNLLNWARTEINIKSFEKNAASINDVYLEIANEFKNRLDDKNLKVETTLPEQSIMQLPPDILRIALRNLISNAIKFSHANATIEIGFNSNTKTMSVKDSGIGISEEKQKLLFKKEVDTGLGTANEEGFGMGLYIVSELLHKYKHSIEVVSSEGKGTSFIIKANS
ncbi:MAG: tetratricopeptide repeat-containing sensor histidine kinase [Bacteroidia bacterium]|nr:tetratricopeptide repeat-containing sensor histidine kinase [Bacteroidia bacterium]